MHTCLTYISMQRISALKKKLLDATRHIGRLLICCHKYGLVTWSMCLDYKKIFKDVLSIVQLTTGGDLGGTEMGLN